MKKNLVLMAVLILGILTMFMTISDRIAVESNNKVVDVVLDYSEFSDMADQSDQPLSWWFEKFGGLGIEYVGLQEETLESLALENNDLSLYMGWEFLQEVSQRSDDFLEVISYTDTKGIEDFDMLVSTKNKELFDFIYKGLESRYDNNEYEILSQEQEYIILLKGNLRDLLYRMDAKLVDYDNKASGLRGKASSSKMGSIALGFDPSKIKIIQESGLKVLPRPYTYPRWSSEKYIKAVFDDFHTYNMKPTVLVSGRSEMIGYPDEIDLVVKYMIDNDIKAGLIESSVQRGHLKEEGLDLLVKSLDYNAVRVFSVWPYIQERFQYYNYEGAEEIENTLYRAVTERNIRLIYFKPIKLDELQTRHHQFLYLTEFEEYEKMFDRFETRLLDHGMTLGRSSTMPSIRVRIAKQSLMSWGIISATIFLLNHFIKLNKKEKYILLALGCIATPLGFVIRPMLMDKVMALWAAIVFPSLSMVYFCHRCFKYIYREEEEYKLYTKILYAIKDLILISLISLIGGLFVASILSNIEYLLEMDIFRGVKFSQILPIIIYIATYMTYFGYKRKVNKHDKPMLRFVDIKKFLSEDIKVIYIILMGILLGIGYVYLARTGHETKIQASTMELILRNILEENLLARPRTKEFLIAFPALMVTMYFAKDKLKHFVFLGGMATIIGQTSIVNTFSHIRTPVYLSMARTIYSLIAGILLGVIYILILNLLIKIFHRLKNRIGYNQNM